MEGPEELDVDALVVELRARVEQRRFDGTYPPDLDDQVPSHFERLARARPAVSPDAYEDLAAAVATLTEVELSRRRIPAGSRFPGGALAHRVIGRVVARQIQGVLEQVQEQAVAVAASVARMAEVVEALGSDLDAKVIQQLDDLHDLAARQARELNAVAGTVEELRARVPGASVDPWYDEERFVRRFRGIPGDLRDRYRDLVPRLTGCEPVLDLGFGGGEFLELLGEAGIAARGIETDPRLVAAARGKGLDVEVGFGADHLAELAPASLGGLVAFQVVEHLTSQGLLDLVRVAADTLRPGGCLMFETVDPRSLFVYAHAFWLDPEHMRPVHPEYLRFLLEETGFAEVTLEPRSEVPADQALEAVPGDDLASAALNRNLERIGGLLFAPQDYLVVARR